MKIAIYPGSFDPVTSGHVDIIRRAAGLCDKLIVAVMHNQAKKPAFSPEERCEMLQRVVGDVLRAVSDFEYEFQMALANRKLNPGVDTVFLMTSAEYMYLSSSIVKDIAAHGGDITGFVPDSIQDDILLRIRKEGNSWQR